MAAVIALVAVMVEAFVGAPLGFLMAQGAGFPFDVDDALCSPGSTQRATDQQQPAPSPYRDHQHNQCLLCHAGAAPAVVGATDHAIFPPVSRISATPIAIVAARETPRPAAYFSRAPPLNA